MSVAVLQARPINAKVGSNVLTAVRYSSTRSANCHWQRRFDCYECFKGIKSIVKIALVEKMPPTTWNEAAGGEYGFYANVNPTVDHPRWTQANERRIGDLERRKTLMFNGYASQVASMYASMDLRKDF